ncbi:hypothetical protein E4K72_18930 [Oxalobacteraceae bacterium OM1]|nr:hypothetical protein E4K72_18930 [Oxalobacteraceae bacterium OM1]
MKKSLIAALVAVPAMAVSSMSFASEATELTATEMDNVTAGARAWVGQINVSPVTIVQLNVLSAGSGNSAIVLSGNFSWIRQ